MHNEIQYNFDASNISPISPLTKSALIDIAHIFENVLQNNTDYDTFRAPKISFKYIILPQNMILKNFETIFQYRTTIPLQQFLYVKRGTDCMQHFLSPPLLYLLI